MRGVKVKARRAGFLTRGGCAQGAFGSICRPLGCYDWEVRSRWQSVLLSPPAGHRKPPQQTVTWQGAEAETPFITVLLRGGGDRARQVSNVSWETQPGSVNPERPTLMSSCASHS